MRKAVIISVSLTLIVVLAIGGVFAWRHYHPSSEAADSNGGSVALDSEGSATTKSGIPLSVGQTNPSATQQNDQAASNNNGLKVTSSGTNTSGNSSSASADPDPITFDKYKSVTQSQYQELVVGSGDAAAAGKKAEVLYRGWLTDGTLFDQSYVKGQANPFVFTPGDHKVISGWEAGIIGMKVGGKRLLILTPDLAYGAKGYGPIPPNAVLIFEIELLAVQ